MMVPADAPLCDARTGRCHVCGDEAVVGRLLDIDARTRTGTVEFPDRRATVALELVDARVGDEVLVHLGFAIERMELT